MNPDQVEAVLQTYVERYRTLRAERPALYPFVFRNHGARAGASLPHPHSQIIASDFPPPRIEREETAARERYDETGQCPYCEMIAEELSAGTRVVWTDDQFVMFVPFAAQGPYELWILPRTHEPEFGRLDAPERTSLATALQTAVRALHDRLDDPDYNFFVRTALEHETDAPHLHWSLRLQPRTSVEAGFERATGVRINPSIPERDADVLREAV
jgi:UDPglucose--hexose-1-phosphate uridylyltransferase